jgi:hypothetical protein
MGVFQQLFNQTPAMSAAAQPPSGLHAAPRALQPGAPWSVNPAAGLSATQVQQPPGGVLMIAEMNRFAAVAGGNHEPDNVPVLPALSVSFLPGEEDLFITIPKGPKLSDLLKDPTA